MLTQGYKEIAPIVDTETINSLADQNKMIYVTGQPKVLPARFIDYMPEFKKQRWINDNMIFYVAKKTAVDLAEDILDEKVAKTAAPKKLNWFQRLFA